MSNDELMKEFKGKWQQVVWMLERDLRKSVPDINEPTIYSDFVRDVGYLMLNYKMEGENVED